MKKTIDFADTVAELDAIVGMVPDAAEPVSAKAPLPPKADWPRLSIPKLGWWWAGAYAAALTAVGFFYAVFTAQHHPWRALIAVVILPFIAIASDYIVRCAATAYRRFVQYGQLHDQLRTTDGRLTQVNEQLLGTQSLVRYLVVGSPRIEIELVQQINGRVFLKLKPGRAVKLQKGDIVQVVDFTDGAAMGTFEITEIKPCLAKALTDLNPVWSGFIHEAGAESSAPGNSAAILIEKESIEDEQ
jgi:hypothetical protein